MEKLILFLLIPIALAVPVIENIETDGTQITITGSGFTENKILRYDDFESGTIGKPLEDWDLHYYGGDNPVPASYTNDNVWQGSQAAVAKFDSQYRNDFGIDRDGDKEYDELFISFYAYLDFSGELSRNYKIFRAYSGAPDDHSFFTIATFPADPGSSWLISTSGETDYFAGYTEDVWQRYNLWIKRFADHMEASMYLDGEFTSYDDIPADSSGHGADELRLGHYLADDLKICTDAPSPHYLEDCGVCSDGGWAASCYSDFCEGTCEFTSLGCDSRGGCNGNVYFDNVYFAENRARVEVCDSADWNSRTHCEIQKIISWTGNTIEFEQNMNGYVFVIDEYGIVSQGYELAGDAATHCPEILPDGMLACADFENGAQFGNPGYIFYTDYITDHSTGTEVISSCEGRSAYDGDYFWRRNYFSGSYDPCLGTTPTSENSHNNIDSGISSTGSDIIVERYMFRLTGDWPNPGIADHTKWSRLYSGDGDGDDSSWFVNLYESASQWLIYDVGNADIDYFPVQDLDDGQWHSFAALHERIGSGNPNGKITVWWDDWDMAGAPSGSKEIYVPDDQGQFHHLAIFSNWGGSQTPTSEMAVEVDNIEIWDRMPGTQAMTLQDLIEFINSWRSGRYTIQNVMEAIQLWKSG